MREVFPRRLVAVTLALLLTLLAAAPVAAVGELSGIITDPDGRLADVAAVEASIEELHDTTGLQLYVLLAGSLPPGADPETISAELADGNGLGASDAVLVITFTDRKFSLWVGEEHDPGATALQRILDNDVTPQLRAGDADGAVIAAASSLQVLVSGEEVVAPPPNDPVPSAPAAPFDFNFVLIGLGLVVVVTLLAGLGYAAHNFLRGYLSQRRLQDELPALLRRASRAVEQARKAVSAASFKLAGDPLVELEAQLQTAKSYAKTGEVAAATTAAETTSAMASELERQMGEGIELYAQLTAAVAAKDGNATPVAESTDDRALAVRREERLASSEMRTISAEERRALRQRVEAIDRGELDLPTLLMWGILYNNFANSDRDWGDPGPLSNVGRSTGGDFDFGGRSVGGSFEDTDAGSSRGGTYQAVDTGRSRGGSYEVDNTDDAASPSSSSSGSSSGSSWDDDNDSSYDSDTSFGGFGGGSTGGGSSTGGGW